MNEFSILCRVLGSLYYRQPQDPLLVPLFTLIREGKLAANWPLEQDELLTRLQKSCDMTQVSADYNALFIGDECAVPPYRSAWVEGATEAEVRAFFFRTRDAISGYASRSHRYIAARGFLAGRSVNGR
ncbi:putative chaperone [Escherichia coli]|uniref:Putative chaperone n=1 Tax=Escherichia coli TaxID=562 RepID=A0A485JGR6_ECOLX|nr:putative chaperone [Escherichia coli]